MMCQNRAWATLGKLSLFCDAEGMGRVILDSGTAQNLTPCGCPALGAGISLCRGRLLRQLVGSVTITCFCSWSLYGCDLACCICARRSGWPVWPILVWKNIVAIISFDGISVPSVLCSCSSHISPGIGT